MIINYKYQIVGDKLLQNSQINFVSSML